jgi:hypothetical protein
MITESPRRDGNARKKQTGEIRRNRINRRMQTLTYKHEYALECGVSVTAREVNARTVQCPYNYAFIENIPLCNQTPVTKSCIKLSSCRLNPHPQEQEHEHHRMFISRACHETFLSSFLVPLRKPKPGRPVCTETSYLGDCVKPSIYNKCTSKSTSTSDYK